MRIAVVGATGQIGAHAAAALERDSHDVVHISRSTGVDVYAGAGLVEALAGVHAVIDASNNRSQDETEIVEFFGRMSRNLLAAEQEPACATTFCSPWSGSTTANGSRTTRASASRSASSSPARFHGASFVQRSSMNSRQGLPG